MSKIAEQLTQDQMAEIQEAFKGVDTDGSGLINKFDLRRASLTGRIQVPENVDIKPLMSEAPGLLNFPTFLTLMGERITEEELRRQLNSHNLSDEEVDKAVAEAHKMNVEGKGINVNSYVQMVISSRH